MMLKALPLVHFLSVLLLKEQMITSVKKTLKTLVWSVQNRSISSEICLENNNKIGRFLPIAFWRSLPWNFPRNSGEIGRFFREFDPKNPTKFDFFPRDLSEALTLTIFLPFHFKACSERIIDFHFLSAHKILRYKILAAILLCWIECCAAGTGNW